MFQRALEEASQKLRARTALVRHRQAEVIWFEYGTSGWLHQSDYVSDPDLAVLYHAAIDTHYVILLARYGPEDARVLHRCVRVQVGHHAARVALGYRDYSCGVAVANYYLAADPGLFVGLRAAGCVDNQVGPEAARLDFLAQQRREFVQGVCGYEGDVGRVERTAEMDRKDGLVAQPRFQLRS